MADSPLFQAVPGPSPLRVIVVGTGAVGMCWSRAVDQHPETELAGLADADPRRARGAAIRLRRPELPTGAGLADLAGIEADACINATPPAAHYDVSAEALVRGMAVLSEKPFAVSLAEAVQLTAAARIAGRLLMISQSRSYEPGLAMLGRTAGGLGRLGLVSTELSVAHHGGGFRVEMAHPLLLDMAVHAFDAVRRLLGAEPVSVYCDAFSPAWSWFGGHAAASAIIEMAGGIRFCYTGSWCSEGLATSWNGRWRVSGEHGSAYWNGIGPPRAEISAGAGNPPPPEEPDGAPASDDLVAQVSRPLEDFVHALRTGTPPWGECGDNLLTLAMVEAAIASAATGTRVDTRALLATAQREAAACA
jgi:predicted dehydrogenase